MHLQTCPRLALPPGQVTLSHPKILYVNPSIFTRIFVFLTLPSCLNPLHSSVRNGNTAVQTDSEDEADVDMAMRLQQEEDENSGGGIAAQRPRRRAASAASQKFKVRCRLCRSCGLCVCTPSAQWPEFVEDECRWKECRLVMWLGCVRV